MTGTSAEAMRLRERERREKRVENILDSIRNALWLILFLGFYATGAWQGWWA